MKKEAYRLSELPDVLIATLENAAALDKKAEKQTMTFGCLSGVSFLAGIVGLTLGANVHWLFGVLGVLGFVAFVTLLTLSILKSRFDIDDRKIKTALRVAKVLRADMGSQDRVQLMLDFREYRKGGKKLPTDDADPKLSKYHHSWMELRTQLADGSAVAATFADRVTRREKPKRKRTKVTERVVGEIGLVVRLAKQYGDGQALLERLSGRPPAAGLAVASWTAKGRGVRIVLRTPMAVKVSNRTTTESGFDRITGDAVLHALRWVFSGLGPARPA